ncbi:alpha/beta fold hydrolase [Actinomadura macra]|uniref:alpha/beta fold hydrolase n=1 Tax=Actinomadura macra TaxID=46164 RepID=UPI0008316349|nr:alpha/beta hydrolase [Actinomadura macra]
MATMDADGVTIYYEDLGEGDPLLLIHGAAASGRWFDDLPRRLAEKRRVIMPDLRGLGRSQRVAPLERPEVWVEDMWRVLDAAGVDRADVAGVSLGTRVAGRLALERPERLRSLIVDAPITGLSAHGNAALKNVFAVVEDDSEQAREWRDLHGDDWRDVVGFYGETRSGARFQEYYTVRPHLAEITVPTLVCRGDHDDSVHPVDDAFVWHKESPHTELFIAPGLTQSSVMKERPDDFLAALDGFLRRRETAAVS